MTMQLQRAFNSKMLSRITKYTVMDGSYDEDNNWVQGRLKSSLVFGVVTAGNKFSQFEEGLAQRVEDGGVRYSDFLSIYMNKKFTLVLEDKIKWRGKYYNVLQKSDEEHFGFNSYLCERSENWSPT